jgi:hypothetical protein
MKQQPSDQRERNEDKKKAGREPFSRDPESGAAEREVVDQDPGHRQEGNQNQKKDYPLVA